MLRFILTLCFFSLLPLAAQAQADVAARTAAMPAGQPGTTDFFILSLAGDGRQWVFNREASLAIDRLEARYGRSSRALLLSNQPVPDLAMPIASRVTVEAAIRGMAARMNLAEDILLIFLTSHGWKDGTIALSNGAVTLPPLSARDLDLWLRQAGVTRSVIIVSACYSGSWAKPLADPGRIVLMAARQDRSSFGCSDDRDLTFFGQALLGDSMSQGLPLLPAFEQAKKIIAGWEADGHLLPSEPQQSLGTRLLPVWQQLEANLGGAAMPDVAHSAPPVQRCRSGRCRRK